MKNAIIFALPGNTPLALAIANQLHIETGTIELRDFPDTETYIRIESDVQNKTVILVCGLEYPNSKILPLMFVAQTLKEMGARKICLISPYLPYMRQDKRFKPGEAVTSTLFAKYLSSYLDSLITIDPHLHRIQQLSQIYAMESTCVLHATANIAKWIADHIESPFIIGPDEESKQWVNEVASTMNAPFAIIKKVRFGDKKVEVSIPELNVSNHTLVLIDDIISTGSSMLAAIQQFRAKGFKKPICIGIHALFNNETYDQLIHAGAEKVLTCNTISHPSNQIDITDIIVQAVNGMA